MVYRIGADLVALAHLGFILFAILGGLLVMRWHWLLWAHLPAWIWGMAVAYFGWICPLTPLENRLRRAGGERGYSGGFIEHFAFPILYPEGLTREIQVGLAAGLLVINILIYVAVWRRLRRRPAVDGSGND